jgi:hypothetical protein
MHARVKTVHLWFYDQNDKKSYSVVEIGSWLHHNTMSYHVNVLLITDAIVQVTLPGTPVDLFTIICMGVDF